MVSKNDDVCEVQCIHEQAVRQVKKLMPDKGTVLRLAETFNALGDPTRVQIIYALSQKELCVCDLASLLCMSQSAVSHQLRLLRNLRLVRFRRQGKIVYYSIDDRHIVNLFAQGLEHVTHD